MKSGITLLSCIMLMGACVATAAEKPATQTELDAKQFASEQAAKEQSAQANAIAQSLALAEQVQQEEQNAVQAEQKKETDLHNHCSLIEDWLVKNGEDKNGKSFDKDKVAKLPNTALALITEFHYGDPAKIKDFARKMIFINNNIEKLLPAIIAYNVPSTYFKTLFQHIDSAHQKLGCLSGRPHYWLSSYSVNPQSCVKIDQTLQFSYPEKLVEPQTARSFIAYWQPQGIVYKVPSNDLGHLKALSHKQLEYLSALYDKRTQAIESFRKSSNQEVNNNLTSQAIQLVPRATTIARTEAEQEIHASLPQRIRYAVEFNYTFAQPQEEGAEEEAEEYASDEEQV